MTEPVRMTEHDSLDTPDELLGVCVRPTDAAKPTILEVSPREHTLDPIAWLRGHREWVERSLHLHGALLFRHFQISTTERFSDVARALSDDFPLFLEESSPRHRINGIVFSSTDYPSEYPIQMHSEYSYANEWPMKLIFGCLQPAASGGSTPVASTRGVLGRLRRSTKDAFRDRGVMYVRNYHQRLGVNWRVAFQCDKRTEVDRRCESAGIRTEWREPDLLRTRQVSQPIVRHPATGEDVWFNHAFFFNVGSLEPPELREFFRSEGEEWLSTQTYFGDGGEIPDVIIDELRAAYAQEKVVFSWQQGDVLVVDNMLAAHGREPFEGSRSIAVVMTDRFRRRDLKSDAA